jgi:hypothetical protein
VVVDADDDIRQRQEVRKFADDGLDVERGAGLNSTWQKYPSKWQGIRPLVEVDKFVFR